MLKIMATAGIGLLTTCSALAQNSINPLRDSLARATEQLSYHPDSIDLRLRKASWNVQLEQWQYALSEYDAVLRMHPRNVAALYYRAFVNERLHRYNFARLDYENLLEVIPGNFEARLGLALLNQKDRHFTEALDGINTLVAAHPDSALAWAARGGIENEQGMLDLAEYDYSKALDLDPDNADYLLSRADIRIRLKQPDKARADLDAIVRLGTPKLALKEWYDQCK
ncbi:MAG: tetratricopeptide repeat protein [Prevotella sp.]|nr:tetratricopeptide repeat protein [Prevotella sp.]